MHIYMDDYKVVLEAGMCSAKVLCVIGKGSTQVKGARRTLYCPTH